MYPSLAASLVDEATEDDPEAAAAEWLGQFRSDLESYISTAVLDGTTLGVVERPVVPGLAYVGFIDAAAGSRRDSFAAAIAHADLQADGQVVAVLDAMCEVKLPFDPVRRCRAWSGAACRRTTTRRGTRTSKGTPASLSS
jgi:hypothetical protein